MPLRFALMTLLTGCFGGTSAEVPTATATMGAFDVTLSVAGELKAENSVSLATPEVRVESLKVTELVEEGARVKEGEIVVRFDQVALQRELDSAESALVVAETKISQARSRQNITLADARGEVTRAELGLERAKMRLTESETVPLIEREGARLDVIEQEMNIERSKSALRAAELQATAEIQLLQIDAEEAQRRIDAAQEQIAQAVIKAPNDGLVVFNEIWKGGDWGKVAVGDALSGGSTIIELPDLSSMQIKAWVHEVDSAKVRKDQPVEIVIDAHPEPPHKGQVSKVADLAVARNWRSPVKHLQVTIDIDETTEIMKPGMTVRAKLLLDHVDEALSVPIEAVTRRDDTAFVWVEGYSGWGKKAVELGIENDTHIIITAGLEAGDVVALVDPIKFGRGESAEAAEAAP